MLNEQTINKMQNLKLHGMAQSFKELNSTTTHGDITPVEFLGLLIDSETTYRATKRLTRLLTHARLKQQACVEDIDYNHPRGLHKRILLELMTCTWIHNHQNILISGPTGVGKTYITCALGNMACRAGHSVLYMRAPKLFTALFQSRADGSYLSYLSKLSRYSVLIIDDIGLSPMSETERKDLLEIVEDRSFNTSLIIASQVALKDWYQIIGDPTIADAICDRLLHNAYKIELKGESMRKKQTRSKSSTNLSSS